MLHAAKIDGAQVKELARRIAGTCRSKSDTVCRRLGLASERALPVDGHVSMPRAVIKVDDDSGD
jgi:hypothetical protein